MSTEIDSATFRRVLGSFLTGVTIITTRDETGELRGITANSFTSVSLDPPLVLFCVGKSSSSCEAFSAAEGYNVHILGSENQGLAKAFATRGVDRFAGVPVTKTRTGAPLLDEVGTWLACETYRIVDAGDHLVVIGRVYDCAVQDTRPLGFYQSQFQSFRTEEELARGLAHDASGIRVGWVVETPAGALLLREEQPDVYGLPSVAMESSDLSEERLSAAAEETLGVPVSIDFLYSLYEMPDGRLSLIYRGTAEDAVLSDSEARVRAVDPAVFDVSAVAGRPERAVVRRYLDERNESRFGIYAGTQRHGAVATISGVNRGEPSAHA